MPRSQFGNYAKIVLKLSQILRTSCSISNRGSIIWKRVLGVCREARAGSHTPDTWALDNNKTLETQALARNMTLTIDYLILTPLADHLDDSGTNG